MKTFLSALSNIADWMTSNILCLNGTKTEFLLLGLRSQLKKGPQPSAYYQYSGTFIPPTASAGNLRFIFETRLTFSHQVSAVSRACFRLPHRRSCRTQPILAFSRPYSSRCWFITGTLKA